MKRFLLSALTVSVIAVSQNTHKEPSGTGKKYEVQKKTEGGYSYETVSNDPLKARIYTLPNGLKVYMTVYKDAPRIQTYVAVAAGSKTDPQDATGLAHYLEHILFKGTSKIGTFDWAQEKVYLDKIEALYEKYRQTKDAGAREKIYHEIDSVSGIAAQFAIANEYDKLVGSIGAQGTNAYTFVEQTVYVNDIPSTQLEKWAMIESERFGEVVARLFHTELEAVYEEKNKGLDNDSRKVWEALLEGVFQKHPYGTQTTIGTIEHLKNPSITEIKKYFSKYYVPNNMAICLSGDLDYDKTIKLIDKYFGKKQAKPVTPFVPPVEVPITKPIVKNVYGPNAESVSIGFRFPGTNTKESMIMEMLGAVLSNGQAGLIDLNLNQKQKLMGGYSYSMRMKDYSMHMLGGNPREGQTLEEVKNLLLGEIDNIKKGKFDEQLLQSIINNSKIAQMKAYESNDQRADAFVTAFTAGRSWKDYVEELDLQSKITKKDLMAFANKYYGENYVVVFKHKGVDSTIQKVPKPKITPVTVNREKQSEFFKQTMAVVSPELQPVFLNFERDITKFTVKPNIPVLYKKNDENKLFELYYELELGGSSDPKIGLAVNYLDFLGTQKLDNEALKKEFYRLGCNYNVVAGEDKVYVMLSGLNDNFEKALVLFEELLANAKPDEEALHEYVESILKTRSNNKLNKGIILRSALVNHVKYGEKSPFTNILSEQELKAIKAEELVKIVASLNGYKHKVLYYGPLSTEALTASLNSHHKVPAVLKDAVKGKEFVELPISETKVYFVNYDMVQAEVMFLSKSVKYTPDLVPSVQLFNQYFGGDMSSLVFQEIRESKALAYAVRSSYSMAGEKDKSNYVVSYIGTQADKLKDAYTAMQELLAKLPRADENFENAKLAILESIKSDRITKSSILMTYTAAEKLGIKEDLRKSVWEKLPAMKFEDVEKFYNEYVKSKPQAILVLGSKDKVDMKFLESLGKVEELSLEKIFGY